MSISLTRVTSAIKEAKISKYWIGYFRENFRGEINDALLESFEDSGLTKADIARKLDRRPEQITRWLSAPCNLEADTLSDIALSLGLVPRIRFEAIAEDRSNARVHDFIAKYENHTDSDSTMARTFIYDQFAYEYETSTPRLSASTDRQSFTRPTPSKAYVREVAANA